MTDEQRVDAVVVRDRAGAYYEIPWATIARHRVSDDRAQELEELVAGDTSGFLNTPQPFQSPRTHTFTLPTAPTTNIIAILIGL